MVIDTTLFIEFLRAKDKTQTILYNLPENTPLYISAVTVFELYAGATTDQKKKDVELIISDLIILPFSVEIAMKAAKVFNDLKRKNQLIEFRDIFIGCTALVHKLPIRTLNLKHFSRISDLEIVDG